MNLTSLLTIPKLTGPSLGPCSKPHPTWHNARLKWITAVLKAGDRRPFARFIRELDGGRSP